MTAPDPLAAITDARDRRLASELIAQGRISPEQLAAVVQLHRERPSASIREILRSRGFLQTPDATVMPTENLSMATSRRHEGLPDEVRRAIDADARRIAGHVVVGELGRGGMGVVYRAYDLELHRFVAIKMILSGIGDDEGALARFTREARTVAKLRHPAIVALHEVGTEDAKPFLVMELIPGRPLKALLSESRLSPHRLAEIAADVADALAHAHDLGIVHRDVKPSNVIVDRDGRPHLMDFGLAHDTTASQQLTATGQILGTPAYMAPEQADDGFGEVGPAADVYGLGVLLYEGLLGRTPFRGTPLELLKKVLVDEPEAPRQVDGHVAPDIDAIVMKCLEKSPPARYESAAALATDLRHFVAGEAIELRPRGRGERARRWARRHRVAAAAIAGAAVAVLGGFGTAGVFAWRAAATRAADEARLIDGARREATETAARFEETRARIQASDVAVATSEADRDALMAAGLDALAAAVRIAALARDDASAAEAFATAVAVGDAAAEVDQWSVARTAYRKAASLGADDAAARAALSALEERRDAAHAARRRAVATIIEQARRDELWRRSDGEEGALRELIRQRHPDTAAAVGDELERVAAAMEAAWLEALVEVAEATPGDADEGEGRLDVEAALERFLEAPLGARRRDEEPEIAAAGRRLDHRTIGRVDPVAVRVRRRVARAIARRQEEAVGRADLRVATFCSEALGHLALPGALAPLTRYLRIEHDPSRAGVAAAALLRAATNDRALREALTARARFIHGTSLPRFWREVRRVPIDARRIDGDEPEDHLVRILLLRSTGRAAQALAHVERLRTRFPDERALQARFVDLLLETGQLDRARQTLDDLVERLPDDAGILASRAMLRARRGDVAGGIADLDRAIELDPFGPDHRSNRAHLRRGSGDVVGGRADLDAAIALAPEDGAYRANRAGVRLEDGDLDGAFRDASRAIALDPHLVPTWQTRAAIQSRRGDLVGARADLGAALDRAPEQPVLWRERARIALALGDHAAARRDIERSLALAPDDVDALFVAGDILAREDDPEAAIETLDRAIELAPERHSAWAVRGRQRRMRLDLTGALADLDEAVRRAPPPGAEAWILAARAEVRLLTGDPAGASTDVDAALARSARAPLAWRLRGELRVMRGDRVGAVGDFDRAIELAPRDAWSLRRRASLRRMAGDPRGAIADADLAIALDPKDAVIWLDRGYARRTLGELDGARADIARYVALAPSDHPLLEGARRVLAELGE